VAEAMDRQTGSGVFHGWKMVGALSVVLFFGAAGLMYVFPVFIESFQAEFGWSITQISSGAAVLAIVMGFSNPVVGALFARFGARNTMLVCATLLALATLGYALLVNLAMLYALLMVSGFAIAGSTILPAQTLIIHWFDRLRGRAMGLTMVGIGAGGLVLPPVNEYLIRLLGWRQTWFCSFLVLAVVVIPLIAIYVRTRPQDLGLLPDGAEHDRAADQSSAPASGLTARSAIRTSAFWLLVTLFLLQLSGVSALNFHFVPFAIKQLEFTSQQAAFYYGFTVGFSILGRLLFGWLGDRWHPTLLLAISLLLLAAGPAVLEVLFLQLGSREVQLLWLYAAPFGTGIGANAVIMPVLVGRCFGELEFSKIMGFLMGGFAVGIIIGIPGAGRIYDTTGSYELVLIACLGALLVATLLATLIRPGRHRPEFVTG
jgi:MFS family permease